LIVSLSIRVAGDADIAVLASLRRRWNEEAAGSPIDDPRFAGAFTQWWHAERDTRTFFVAEMREAVVGMANVKRYDRMPAAGAETAGTWGYVGNVFVLPEHRNAGIGEALMKEILAWAATNRFAHLRLAPSPRSRPFYARLGYVPGAVVELDPPGGDGQRHAPTVHA
jgi:GNAT superfamily N-acetyltransferase